MTTQSANAIASFTQTGQHAQHVSYGVSPVVIVDLGNSILLKIFIMRAQMHLLYHCMLHSITPILAWIAMTVCVSHAMSQRFHEKS